MRMFFFGRDRTRPFTCASKKSGIDFIRTPFRICMKKERNAVDSRGHGYLLMRQLKNMVFLT